MRLSTLHLVYACMRFRTVGCNISPGRDRRSLKGGTTMIVFVTIALVGLVFLAISALFGGDHDFGHDFSTDHGVEVHPGEHGGDGEGGPGPFSLRVLALFMVAFGASGAIAHHRGSSYPLSSFAGLLAGLALGAAGWQFMKLLWSQQSSSTVSARDFIGLVGEVKTAIPSAGPGQISVIVKGQRMHRMARTRRSGGIEEGVTVVIVDSGPDAVVVERMDPIRKG